MTDKFPRVSKEYIAALSDRCWRYMAQDRANAAVVTASECSDLLLDRADMEAALAESQTKAKAYVDEADRGA